MRAAAYLARSCAGFLWRRGRDLCLAGAEACDRRVRRLAAGSTGLAAGTLIGLALALAALAWAARLALGGRA